MKHIYNYSLFLKFSIMREKTLINLDRKLLIEKLFISQNLLHKKTIILEKLIQKKLIPFGNFNSNLMYRFNNFNYEHIIESISYCEFMNMRMTQEIKKIIKKTKDQKNV